jgi:NADH-quinone oxidoreductase subunit N
MTVTDFISLAPLLIIAGAPIIMMLTIAFVRSHKVIWGFSVIAFIVALASLYFVSQVAPHDIKPLFIFDKTSLFFMGMIIGASLIITLLSYDYLKFHMGEKEEYYIILFVSTLGALILTTATHFVSFFLGLETLSVSLYILIAYLKSRDNSIEAGVKYLVLAASSSAFLLFGMALIYTVTGTMNFKEIGAILISSDPLSPMIYAGFGMMIVGLGFKLALVPFHMWIPDVYQGAPVPVTAFIATISKGGVMALFLRFFFAIQGGSNSIFISVLSILAILSMFTGNFLALQQLNLKRMLAYSSIAHLGYLMITILAGNILGLQAAIFYLLAYFITSLGAFSVISLLSVCEQDAEQLDNFRGLFWKRPWLAVVMTLSMLSLAGIPLTAGFMSKFYLVFSGFKSNLILLVFCLVVNSVISLYYYLKVVTTMFSTADDRNLPVVSFTGNIVLVVVVIGILWIGLIPGSLFHFITEFASF